MEITPDQKRAICTILVEQAGRRVRNTELTALCDDDTITAALHFLIRLIEIKHAEITAGQAAALAELQSQNPQMVMGSLLSGSSLSVQNGETTEAEPAEPEAAVSNTPVEENTEEATETQDPLKNHSWLFEDTDTDDTDLPPLGMFSEPTEKQDDITEQPQAALKETVAEPVEDTITESADKPAQPATAVLSDIFSFSGTPDVPQRKPVNTPVITETTQRELPADTVTIPVKDHTEETAEDTAAKVADHIASIFGDKSLFPEFAEPAETQDPLKNHSWLFEDTDTDDTDLPPLGMFSEPTEKQNDITEQPQAALKETVAEPVEDTVAEPAGKPAQPATAVLSDIFSFSGTPDVPQREPVNTPVITETAQRELPADTVTIPVKDHTEETADDTAAKVADHIASIFGDKSLFPEFAEPAGTQDLLKNHSWLFEDTDTNDTDLPPLGMFSKPTEKQDDITEQPQAALKETVAEPVEDTVTEPAGKPAQPATAVLSDIFSFSGTPDVPQSEPVNTPVITEAAQSEFPADTVTIPVKDHTEETTEDTAAKVADHIASIFGDKSLFPEFAEPAETQDPLKNHSWLFEDTDTNDTDLPPLGMFSEPTEKQDDITEQPQAALKETVAEPVEDTVTEPAGKPAQPATAVLSDIFSFSGTPDVPQSEPVNTPIMAEAAQSESPSEQEITPCNASAVAVTLPAEGNTENQAASDVADHMTSVFSDKSLFPELSDLTGKPGQLKNHSWLFDDLDTDDSDTPAIGDLPAEPVQHVPTGTTQFNSLPPATKQQDNDLLAENWLFADDTDAADPKPWGLAALLAAGKTSGKNRDKPATTPTGPVFKDVTKDSKPVTEPEKEQGSEYISLPPAGPADIMTAHSDTQADPLMPPAPTRPTIRIEVARARQNEPFNSPVTATLHDGRHVSVLGIYFQSSIGLNFNERTSTLYGKPTESGEFSLRVVWELTPKRRFSTDVTFFVSPDPHSPPPLPEIYASPAE